ncbi:hypothetical protein EON66_10875 [archaeon]|nr:MAG: hypothetical protein EON66_10875 [archaeon]
MEAAALLCVRVCLRGASRTSLDFFHTPFMYIRSAHTLVRTLQCVCVCDCAHSCTCCMDYEAAFAARSAA